MKKSYSLDYSIERDIDRCKAVAEILDTLTTNPNNTELEQMANYIIYGKDENGKNAIQRQEATDSNTRYKNFARMADQNISLDEILDNPLFNEASLVPLEQRDHKYVYLKKRPSIARPKYDKKTGALIDPGDSLIPGMTDLWEAIDRLTHVYNVGTGKVAPDPETEVITSDYRLYKLKHQLMDMRRQQYYLKDAYQPTIHFFNVPPPAPQTVDWDGDAQYWCSLEYWQNKVNNAFTHRVSKNLADYTTRINEHTGATEVLWIVQQHNFDWENPKHIKQLIKHYSAVRMQVQEKLFSWGRTLIYDFDRYQEMLHLSDLEQYILDRTIDGANCKEIAEEIPQVFYGLTYDQSSVFSTVNEVIPRKMATLATRNKQLITTPMKQRKRCTICGQMLPRTLFFFHSKRSGNDGFSTQCKDCLRERRIKEGVQPAYDRRNKSAALYQMQTKSTGN